jgi:predicted DNA-binding transcriptional regulator AlpA
MRNQPEKSLTFDEVRSLFDGLHRAKIWRLIKDSKFPRPITFCRKLFWRPSRASCLCRQH